MIQNHLEISSKYHFWIRSVRNSSNLFYGKLTESLRNPKTCPGGPIRAHMGPYGPLWAHEGPYGPIYGPIWAPTRIGPKEAQWNVNSHCVHRVWTSSQQIKLQSGLGPGPGWDPYGPIYGPIWALMGPYMGPCGPIWAHMGPCGPIWAHVGPYGSSWTGLGKSVNFP